MFLANMRAVTTCLDSERVPASPFVTTCLHQDGSTCLRQQVTTCLLSCPCLPSRPVRKDLKHMVFQQPDERSSSPTSHRKTSKRVPDVTEARARAQRAKLETLAKARQRQPQASGASKEQTSPASLQTRRRTAMTLTRAIDDYLQDHEGGNSSRKTLEWHRTALGLLQRFLEEERGTTLVEEVEAADISAWFAYLRKASGKHGRPRAERTIQTYARSVRAFFHWLVRREIIERNPFDRVVFPKVGKPLIRTIEPEEFEQLLRACVPPGESGPMADRAAVRNRAILWLLYDTGIRISELCGLRLSDIDRRHGPIRRRSHRSGRGFVKGSSFILPHSRL